MAKQNSADKNSWNDAKRRQKGSQSQIKCTFCCIPLDYCQLMLRQMLIHLKEIILPYDLTTLQNLFNSSICFNSL